MTDLDGKSLIEGKYSDELVANPGKASERDYGILTLDGNLAKFDRYRVKK